MSLAPDSGTAPDPAVRIVSLIEAFEREPTNLGVQLALTQELLRVGRVEEALVIVRSARALAPTDPDGAQLEGMALEAVGQEEAALERLEECLMLAPDRWNVRLGLVGRLAARGLRTRARRQLEQGLALHPSALGSKRLGLLCIEDRRFDEARVALERAAQDLPGDVQVLFDLGWLEKEVGRPRESERWLRAALEVDPDHADARYNLAQTLLSMGRDEEGWAAYEARLICDAASPRRGDLQRWDGRESKEATLVVTAEQGLGDVVMFSRFLSAARARVGRLVFEAGERLGGLLRAMPGVDEVVAPGDSTSATFTVPVGSLPRVLGLRTREQVDDGAYLSREMAPGDALRDWLAARSSELIALHWQGNPAYPGDATRSLPLELFGPLARRGRELVSAQSGAGREQVASVPFTVSEPPLPGDRVEAFRDTRALLASCRALVTSDTAIAHVAGAMGVETHLLLSRPAEWRWGHEGETCSWYRSVTLHRQVMPGDWSEAIASVVRHLE